MEARTALEPSAVPGRAGWARASAARPTTAAILVVAVLTLVGLALRLATSTRALFADELSTSWIVQTHGLRGVFSTVHSNAEITPPLYFVLSWASAKLGHAPELIRLPSLVAGTATIPLIWLLGRRTVGDTAALLATAIATVAPFLVYYSAEARGYALMVALVVLSTWAMLEAVDTGRRGWWALYAVATCGAAYSHYTCIFLLGAQLVWLWWAHPEARKASLIANGAAIVGFLPWITGLHNDLTSPTSTILSALSPFTLHDIRIVLEHWTVGYPYASVPLRRLPGDIALVLLALGVLVAAVGVVRALLAGRGRTLDRRIVLVVVLALSVPVGEAAVSLVSTHLFGVRNLAASWPGFVLALAAFLLAAGPRLRVVAAALTFAGFAIGGAQMLRQVDQRPDYGGAASYIDAHARPGDVVIDRTGVLSPGPLTALDASALKTRPVLRAGAPAERDHPYTFLDPIVSNRTAVARAVRLAHGRRVFVVKAVYPSTIGITLRLRAERDAPFPAPYRKVGTIRYPGFVSGVVVQVYAAR